jgi:hypothetical protein
MVEVKKAEDEQVAFWGATQKTCPMCAEKIAIDVLTCPYCNSTFADIRPKSRDDLIAKGEDPSLAGYRKQATFLFVFSILGCTSPFALAIGSYWYFSNREQIERAGPSAKALSLVGLGVCFLYIFVFSLGLLVYAVSS